MTNTALVPVQNRSEASLIMQEEFVALVGRAKARGVDVGGGLFLSETQTGVFMCSASVAEDLRLAFAKATLLALVDACSLEVALLAIRDLQDGRMLTKTDSTGTLH